MQSGSEIRRGQSGQEEEEEVIANISIIRVRLLASSTPRRGQGAKK